jgi:uncharacterized membrane protein YbhN (UPF0104 family)
MPQEVRFRGLAQVLKAVFAIGSWTPWLVRRDPMQIESLRISKVMTALVTLTFLSWTVEGPICVVAHHITGVENEVCPLVASSVASVICSVCCWQADMTMKGGASFQY